jgi:hypothetical protein
MLAPVAASLEQFPLEHCTPSWQELPLAIFEAHAPALQ